MDALVEWASGHSWWIYVTTVVTVASAIMAIMPSTVKDASWYNVVMKGINYLAINIGKAKSADDKTKIVVK